jgi:hypothetical protein
MDGIKFFSRITIIGMHHINSHCNNNTNDIKLTRNEHENINSVLYETKIHLKLKAYVTCLVHKASSFVEEQYKKLAMNLMKP